MPGPISDTHDGPGDPPERRYFSQCGFDPVVNGKFTIAGPQLESKIPEGVRDVLDMPGIKYVAVVFDHGQGERIEIFHLIKEPEQCTTEKASQ